MINITNITNYTQPYIPESTSTTSTDVMGWLTKIGTTSKGIFDKMSITSQQHVSYTIVFIFALIGIGFVIYKVYKAIKG